jgi:ParB/RepB/Spo0J family partition protein
MTENMKVVTIPIDDIDIDFDFNSRGKVIPADVVKLSEDIESKGLIQPVVVREFSTPRNGKKYGLVAGFRRVVAFKRLGRDTIPASIKYDLSDIDAQVINLQENLERQDLNLLQEAKTIFRFKIAGMTQRQVADKLGVSTGWVQIRYCVLDLPPELQERCADGTIKTNQVRQLHELPRSRQFEEVRKLADKRLRGEKGLTITKPVSYKSKRTRNGREMSAMKDHIYENVGPGLHTRVLAWATGDISSSELFHDIKEMCGKDYVMPEEELS